MVEFIIWVLAIYGLIEIIKTIIISFTKINFTDNGIYVIIAVKNQEMRIEGFLRSFLFRIIYGKEEYIKDIYITDLDSTDGTRKILEKLEQEQQIKLYDWQACKQIIEKKV